MSRVVQAGRKNANLGLTGQPLTDKVSLKSWARLVGMFGLLFSTSLDWSVQLQPGLSM